MTWKPTIDDPCQTCPRETPEASYGIEWGPFGWYLTDDEGNTMGTPHKEGKGQVPWHFKTHVQALKKSESLLRAGRRKCEFRLICGDCPYLKKSFDIPSLEMAMSSKPARRSND